MASTIPTSTSKDKSGGAFRSSSVRSVTRALAVLRAVAWKGATLTEVATRVGIPIATAARLLATLESEEFVVKDDDGRIYLGPIIQQLAYSENENGYARWLVRLAVDELGHRFNETFAFFVPDGDHRICTESFESTRSVRWTCKPGTRVPIHLGAAGKVLLAFGTPKRVLPLLSELEDPYQLSDGRYQHVAELIDELEVIRAKGYADSEHESTSDSWGYSVPVYSSGKLLGTLGFAIPSSRAKEAYRNEIAEACLLSASEIWRMGELESSAAST